jgi:glycosyltransferase involved in cell wall biosynthesis
MVISEAMSSLPVITTRSTAGRDLIKHGQNGFIVRIPDADAIAQTMQWCIEHSDALAEIGRQALITARNWQWSDYRALLGRVVRGFVEDREPC